MSRSLTERCFSLIQTIVFKQIGAKIPTNSLKRLMDRLFIIVEKIGNNFSVFSSFYLSMYEELVDQEIAMARLSSEHRILVIGSGALPATAILYAQKTHAKIITIDRDQQTICQAIRFIQQFQLGDRLIMVHADGFSYPLDNFDVIVVLYGVKRQQGILEHIAQHMNKDTQVIFRTMADTQGKFLDPQLDIAQYFLIKKHVRSEALGSFDSFLLQKK